MALPVLEKPTFDLPVFPDNCLLVVLRLEYICINV